MLRTHRQRVPAMLAVACVGMMVYGLAGASPDDGRQLAPAEATAPAAKSDSTPSTTGKDGKGSSAGDCKPTTSTTTKDGGGKDSGGKDTTSTTAKDSGGKDTTSTTAKDSGGKDTTSTTAKDGTDSGSTPTTSKDGKDSTPTTGKSDPKASAQSVDAGDLPTTAEVKGGGGSDKGGSTTATTTKSDSGSAGKDNCDSTTPTTDKGGKDTTDTTRKGGGKNSTTTTTDRKDRPTTSTTDKRGTVDPATPGGGGDPGGSADPGGSGDPNSTPIEPMEAPPDNTSYDPGPDATDPGDGGGNYSDMPDQGPVAWDDNEVAISPMAAPGEAAPVIPSFGNGFYDGSGRKPATPNSPSRSYGQTQQVAAPPLMMSSSGSVQASSAASESAAVSRQLGGSQTSATESAFPASIISTPRVFPINRRDPLAAAALILLAGVARELFKAWRRQANNYWAA